MNTIYPLVSCTMPTANRENFIPHAVRYFQRQDYPNKELIIIDDGRNPVRELIPDDPSIKYERLDQALLTGAKRNLACTLSNGEIIIHWDDDDWYARNWISYQVDILKTTGADICGLSQLFFYAPLQKRSWKYIYPPHDRPWVAGATMAYQKKFWENHPFKNVKIGEDNSFARDSRPKIFAHNYIEGVIAMIHPKNTSPKYTNNARWKPTPLTTVANILKEDMKLYTLDFLK